jgi:3',5'-cyclic AMP phosphodiesterase CpdA
VIGSGRAAEIATAGRLRFHCVGDTGGWVDPVPERWVAQAMVAERSGSEPVDFLYHLGDVVYPHGEEGHYGAQFFCPYAEYDAPIFAVPGNHDGESGYPRRRTLEPFVRTFCAASPPLRDAAVDVPRPAAGQPHVHWTLVHQWLWIIGMYSNVHEDGEVAADQLDWLEHELADAPQAVTVLLVVHRPIYSADVVHGSNLDLGAALDRCFARAGRIPDAVLSGHAHNYQRFSRRIGGHLIPYLVAGAGGFHELHRLGSGVGHLPAHFSSVPELALEAYEDDAHGYLTVTVTPQGLEVVYNVVAGDGVRAVDVWAVSLPV